VLIKWSGRSQTHVCAHTHTRNMHICAHKTHARTRKHTITQESHIRSSRALAPDTPCKAVCIGVRVGPVSMIVPGMGEHACTFNPAIARPLESSEDTFRCPLEASKRDRFPLPLCPPAFFLSSSDLVVLRSQRRAKSEKGEMRESSVY
jgi:hypothetical protein